MEDMLPKILYHYCSAENFYNIMKNKSIWLSEMTKSNDSGEMLWLQKQCEKNIEVALQSYKNQHPSERENTLEFIDKLHSWNASHGYQLCNLSINSSVFSRSLGC